MNATDTYDYSDELNENRRRIRGGCTIGRVINLCMALDFLLVMITALIVSGTLGGVNLSLQESFKDHHSDLLPVNHEVCILYAPCDDADEPCSFRYNKSGVCKYVEVAFGFVALVALVYIVVSIVRAVLTTNISFTAFVDFALLALTLLVTFTTGVTISIGLSITCTSVRNHYGGGSCDRIVPGLSDENPTPMAQGESFYRSVNISQSCAWLCFAFLGILFIMSLVRMVIFIKRRSSLNPPDNVEDITDVLTRDHGEDEEEEAAAKPI